MKEGKIKKKNLVNKLFAMGTKCEKGNISELISACVCMLMLAILMAAYLDNVKLLQQKAKVNQLARKYILIMETEGYLEASQKTSLIYELEELGIIDISLEGSTEIDAGYGQPIKLIINGKLKENYEFTEKRMSTAKN